MAALKNQLDALACRQASESMLPGYPRLEMYSFCPTSWPIQQSSVEVIDLEVSSLLPPPMAVNNAYPQ